MVNLIMLCGPLSISQALSYLLMKTSWPVCSALVQYLVMCMIQQMVKQPEGGWQYGQMNLVSVNCGGDPSDNTEVGGCGWTT